MVVFIVLLRSCMFFTRKFSMQARTSYLHTMFLPYGDGEEIWPVKEFLMLEMYFKV